MLHQQRFITSDQHVIRKLCMHHRRHRAQRVAISISRDGVTIPGYAGYGFAVSIARKWGTRRLMTERSLTSSLLLNPLYFHFN